MIPRLLRADEIETRVKQFVDGKGLSLLLYKTARVDMDILDETYGAENWTNDYKEIKGILYCGIAVKNAWKWDCGKESNTEAKKGEASDAFKRAGFRWGIGRELYSAPFIWIEPDFFETKMVNGKKTPKDSFSVKEITYNDKRKIVGLEIVNDRTKAIVYRMNSSAKPEEKPIKQMSNEAFETIANGKKFTCADCGKEITDSFIADGTLKAYGRVLCRECGLKEKHSTRAKNGGNSDETTASRK